jgi:nucleoside-triphosphatase
MEGRAPKLLLEGRPGVGKTTVVRRLAAELREAGVPVGGFVTRELRERGERRGFVAEELDGPEALIAHVGWSSGPAVGRYHVDVDALERIALPAMRHAQQQGGVILIDELGRMELASDAFVSAVLRLLDGDLPVVATVHARSHPVTDPLKRREDVEVIEVSHENRDELAGRLSVLLAKIARTRR